MSKCYDALCAKSREISLISHSAGVLGWDQETYMPKGGVEFRAQQLSWLTGKVHELSTSDAFRASLEAAEEEFSNSSNQDSPASFLQMANLREFRHQFDRATKLPQSLVEKASTASSLGKAAWSEAREKSDFSLFAPYLNDLLKIAREKADLWGYEDEPYDALFSGFERGAKTSDVTALFDSIGKELAEIATAAVEKSTSIPADRLLADYPIEKQQLLNREVAESIGFDFDRGRIDTTTHPFCTGLGPNDTRLTTRYLENDFTSSLFGVLHEAGHGLYDQGLPCDQFGLPVGEASSLGIHESQSRLWENHVGRSRPFWVKWFPRAQEIFPNLRSIDLDDFLLSINRAEKSSIRVEADEATYDLHILLRFNIERAMLNREIDVNDIPEVWNTQFEQLFGFAPKDDADGCLQDIHWSMGGLGYFATYTLGNLNSAQLHESAMRDPNVAQSFEKGDFLPLLTWMREKIHRHGSAYFPQDLIKNATGETTQTTAYLTHLKKRFLS